MGFYGFSGRHYLYHWTSSFSRPGPDESPADYWKAVAVSDSPPRTAWRNLWNIADKQCVFGGNRGIKGKSRVVCFTAMPPSQAFSFMNWRNAHRRFEFEPYGIAVKKSVAAGLGLRSLRYHPPESSAVDGWPVWATHSLGQKSDWSGEREYRLYGDLRLRHLPPGSFFFLVPDIQEALAFQDFFKLPCRALQNPADTGTQAG